jgi:hypothetical protein
MSGHAHSPVLSPQGWKATRLLSTRGITSYRARPATTGRRLSRPAQRGRSLGGTASGRGRIEEPAALFSVCGGLGSGTDSLISIASVKSEPVRTGSLMKSGRIRPQTTPSVAADRRETRTRSAASSDSRLAAVRFDRRQDGWHALRLRRAWLGGPRPSLRFGRATLPAGLADSFFIQTTNNDHPLLTHQ